MHCERILANRASGIAVAHHFGGKWCGEGLWNVRLAGTMLNVLTARGDNQRKQVPAKADKIVVACKM